MIPKIIHRIWIKGSPPVPEWMVENGEKWKKLNPGWRMMLWDGPKGFRMKNCHLYRNRMQPDMFRFRSDLLRLEVLELWGGVYVDMDMEPLRPIEELIRGKSAVVGYSPDRWQGQRVVSNAFIAAVPRHPWIRSCVDRMRISVKVYAGQFTAMVSGPHHLNRCLKPEHQVHILDPSILYPVHQEELHSAFAFHSWENRKQLRKESLP